MEKESIPIYIEKEIVLLPLDFKINNLRLPLDFLSNFYWF